MLPARAAGPKGKGGARGEGGRNTWSPASPVPSPHPAFLRPAPHLPGTQAPPLQTLLAGNFTDHTATANSPACPRSPAWLCHEAGLRGGGGREDALCEQETFQRPHPTFASKSRALPCSHSVLPAVGWLGELRSAGNMNLPPATNFMENKLSPCRTEQLGLGMWARSRTGLRRGECGCMGGRAGDTISLRAPQRRRNETGSVAAKKGYAQLLSLPPPPSPLPGAPSSNLLDTGSWIIKSRLGRGRREGRAGKSQAGSAAPSLFPRLSELPHPEKEAWLSAAAMAAAARRKAAPGRGTLSPCRQPRLHQGRAGDLAGLP